MITKFHQFTHTYRLQIILAVGFRVGYSIWLAIVWFFVDKWFPQTEQALWESYYFLSPSSTLLGRAFIDVWLRWDAVHYMNIAAFGYKGVGLADTVYFPLYPYLVGGIARITTLNVTVIGLIVSTLATLFALICLRKLVVSLFHNEALADLTTVAIAIYPTAFFLHAPFTDALFLACTIASILMMVKRQHILGGLLACAASVTRPEGLLLLIPMFIYMLRKNWGHWGIKVWREIMAILVTPLGFGAFYLWRQTYSDLGIFQSLASFSRVRFQIPFFTLWNALVGAWKNPDFTQISELISILLFLAILIWMFTKHEFIQHIEIMLYSLASLLLFTSKTTFSASPLQSSNRYVLHIFFVFVGIAMLMQKIAPRTRHWISLLSIILGMICVTLYSLWVFVG